MATSLRNAITDAIRYWEPRRLLYNIVLAGIVMFYFVLAWPASRSFLELDSILFLFILAVLANVAYCAAYVPDVFAQISGVQETWSKYRWVLLAIGILFAAVLTRFWSIALFQNVR